MPSFAEGFGLPPAEALALGTPVIANDLPVYHEVLGNNPVYVPVANMYSWAEKIIELAQADRKERKAAVGEASWLPTWQEHFNLVLKVT
jgi:glycosyltransferase involved in cell wall biosynthesis